ncbi:hypothetical protein [Streptomyces sp. A1499]|uniref:hypothetical protein n=1 Tax=Streptomyces sp. A1499 TaxID=2563104 RepID=UPI00144AEF2B
MLGPLGAWWLRERDEGLVVTREVVRVVRSRVHEGQSVLTVETLGGRVEEPAADHVIAATGHRVDIAALDFLGRGLRARLATSRGAPKLGVGCALSLPGLSFTGMLGGSSYGPAMRFVCGTGVASPRPAGRLAAAYG